MKHKPFFKLKFILRMALLLTTLAILYFISLYNYLLFHVLAEMFGIVIAFGVFTIAWNTKENIKNGYLLFIGIAYFFVGFQDLLHTIGYTGMNIITDYQYYGNQLWISARYMESLSLLVAFVFLKDRKVHPFIVFTIYILITSIILVIIFGYKAFPVCYVDGIGQTPFKIISEYIVIAILASVMMLFLIYRKYFEKIIFRLLIWSVIFTMISELSFTLYISNYGFANIVGHFFKIFSFYMIYKAIIVNGLKEPVALLFSELKEREENLKRSNATKDRLFSIIAHDLRNPFNALVGLSEILVKSPEKIDPQSLKSLYSEFYKAAQKGNALLENLLEWSLSQMGKKAFAPSTFKFKNLVTLVVDQAELNSKEKDISIHNNVSTDLEVFGDKNLIQTIMRNLVSNSIKFTKMGGSISINAMESKGFHEIMVTDTGIGMSDEEASHIFDNDKIFTKLGTANEKGTGLGLPLCNELTKKHNGYIEVRSRLGAGTTFIVHLPKAGEAGDTKDYII